MKHTITQDDPVKAISDMRLAIKNTNVVLNLAISPGLILIPSNMIISKEEVAGYNNTLTLATKEMKSGVNEEVNKVALTLGGGAFHAPAETVGFVDENSKGRDSRPFGKGNETLPLQPTQGESVLDFPSVIPEADGTAYLLGTAVTLGFVVARYVI